MLILITILLLENGHFDEWHTNDSGSRSGKSIEKQTVLKFTAAAMQSKGEERGLNVMISSVNAHQMAVGSLSDAADEEVKYDDFDDTFTSQSPNKDTIKQYSIKRNVYSRVEDKADNECELHRYGKRPSIYSKNKADNNSQRLSDLSVSMHEQKRCITAEKQDKKVGQKALTHSPPKHKSPFKVFQDISPKHISPVKSSERYTSEENMPFSVITNTDASLKSLSSLDVGTFNCTSTINDNEELSTETCLPDDDRIHIDSLSFCSQRPHRKTRSKLTSDSQPSCLSDSDDLSYSIGIPDFKAKPHVLERTQLEPLGLTQIDQFYQTTSALQPRSVESADDDLSDSLCATLSDDDLIDGSFTESQTLDLDL